MAAKWYSSGQHQYEKEYEDGKLAGLSIKWYSNGQKQAENSYKSGQLFGDYMTWYENGQQAIKGKNKADKKDGKWTYWYSNGELEQEIEYADGKIVRLIQNGKILDFGEVKDIDGNVYSTIEIGNQVWMAENLKVTHYRNGDFIPYVTNNSKWEDLKTGAYCNYDNNIKNTSIYGNLYNWYAVKDTRKVAPEGWHIPTYQEWKELENYLGSNVGGKLKESRNGYWKELNKGATNASGFSAIPGGWRGNYHGTFSEIGRIAFFWSASENSSVSAWDRYLHSNRSVVDRSNGSKQDGHSVRCIKD